MKERTLLVVDDSPSIRALIKNESAVSELFSHIIEAEDGMEAIKIFFKNKVDFIITDVEMPKVDGYKLVSAVRDSETGRDVPVIMLSANRQEALDKIRGLNIGANDYVLKPFDLGELLARIKVFIKLKELQEELKEKNALLEKLAITDELTGIYNRRHFYDHIKMHMALAKRYKQHISCILIDIDHFKKINDTMGHDMGDRVLREVAGVMKSVMRDGEVMARFGGEEFIVCLYKTDERGALVVAERIRKMVESTNFSEAANDPVRITISVGGATFSGEELTDSDTIIKSADKALYHAKRTGRNKTIIYSGSLPPADSGEV